MNLLIKANPEWLKVPDLWQVVHISIAYFQFIARISLQILGLTLEAFQESCVARDMHGLIPYPYLYTSSNATNATDIYNTLSNANPERCSSADKYGQIPMHYAFSLEILLIV